jgi:hypothetical protein
MCRKKIIAILVQSWLEADNERGGNQGGSKKSKTNQDVCILSIAPPTCKK